MAQAQVMTWVSSVGYTADAVGEVSLHVVGGGKWDWAAVLLPLSAPVTCLWTAVMWL